MSYHGTVSSDVLTQIIHRIVEVANPERIIMFGSSAEGRMGPNSDVDLLVVSDHDEKRGEVVGDIYVALHGIGQPVDIVMVTPEELKRYGNSAALIIRPALNSGKEVYRAPGATTE